jgi:hypothetical protein
MPAITVNLSSAEKVEQLRVKAFTAKPRKSVRQLGGEIIEAALSRTKKNRPVAGASK